jgi:hypothetical protein
MRIRIGWSAALAASAALIIASGGAQAQTVAGDWHGTLEFNGNTSAILVTLKAKSGGGYEGSYVGPRATQPIHDVKLDKGTLSFSTVPAGGGPGGGTYSGRWDPARKAWVGQWSPQFTMSFVPAGGAPPQGAPPPGPPPQSAGPLGFPPLTMPLVLMAGKP